MSSCEARALEISKKIMAHALGNHWVWMGSIRGTRDEMSDAYTRLMRPIGYPKDTECAEFRIRYHNRMPTSAYQRSTDCTDVLLCYPESVYLFDLDPDAVKLLASCGNDAATVLHLAVKILHEEKTKLNSEP